MPIGKRVGALYLSLLASLPQSKLWLDLVIDEAGEVGKKEAAAVGGGAALATGGSVVGYRLTHPPLHISEPPPHEPPIRKPPIVEEPPAHRTPGARVDADAAAEGPHGPSASTPRSEERPSPDRARTVPAMSGPSADPFRTPPSALAAQQALLQCAVVEEGPRGPVVRGASALSEDPDLESWLVSAVREAVSELPPGEIPERSKLRKAIAAALKPDPKFKVSLDPVKGSLKVTTNASKRFEGSFDIPIYTVVSLAAGGSVLGGFGSRHEEWEIPKPVTFRIMERAADSSRCAWTFDVRNKTSHALHLKGIVSFESFEHLWMATAPVELDVDAGSSRTISGQSFLSPAAADGVKFATARLRDETEKTSPAR